MDSIYSKLKRKDAATYEFVKKCLEFPFESEEEAKKYLSEYMDTEDVVFKIKEGRIPLDTPFTMRGTVEKNINIEKRIEDAANDAESSDSSSSLSYIENIDNRNDIKLHNIDLAIKGKKILENADLTIIRNRIYGLVGRNGIGKSTFLNALRKRKFGISRGISIYFVRQETHVKDISVLDFVCEKLDDDADITNAKKMLESVGFGELTSKTKLSYNKLIKELSGGWAVRASLAKAIVSAPDLLLLDEPTNMLDIPTIAWLEKHIVQLKTTVIIVSHDREFLNNITTDILHLDDLRLQHYSGNYDSFVVLKQNYNQNQQKLYEKQKADREHLQKFVDKFRYNAKRATLAQSKIKILENMEIIKAPKPDPIIKFTFDCTDVSGTLLDLKNVNFSYGMPDKTGEMILQNVSLKINDKTRIVVVGPNGAGKSTLLKLLSNKMDPSSGTLIVNPKVKAGYFAQHHVDHLSLESSPLQCFSKNNIKEEDARKAMSKFGLLADHQKIKVLSGGQKCRLAFSMISIQKPNILILDEPTNHLDMESIDGLAKALQTFKGAVICVSHDLKFVEQVFDEVWVCKDKNLTLYKGTVRDYKESLTK